MVNIITFLLQRSEWHAYVVFFSFHFFQINIKTMAGWMSRQEKFMELGTLLKLVALLYREVVGFSNFQCLETILSFLFLTRSPLGRSKANWLIKITYSKWKSEFLSWICLRFGVQCVSSKGGLNYLATFTSEPILNPQKCYKFLHSYIIF